LASPAKVRCKEAATDAVTLVQRFGSALATVVGVLIEVPVMLAVVRAVNASKAWYERGEALRC
jgi:ACR3 family arsenite efflux pump ArsB